MYAMNSIPEYKKSKKRVLTKRGVLWLGQTCNLRCRFCYFIDRVTEKTHPEHAFMSIEKAEKICDTLAGFYKNRAIDIQGGEPTIYPHIHKLVTHCRNIGLLPTLITNAVVLSDRDACRKLKDAGVRDYLVSLHGIGDAYDELVGVKGAHKRQMEALENIIDVGTPFRINCVLSKNVLPDLRKIVSIAVMRGVRVVNFIVFNPFEDQGKTGKRSSENVPRHSEVVPYLTEVMEIIDEAGIECNIRYFPICLVPEKFRKSVYNFQQLNFDLHEWDLASGSWTGIQSQKMKEGDTSPVVTLEEATCRMNTYSGKLKFLTLTAKSAIERFPGLKEPLTVIGQKISDILQKKRLSSECKNELDELYIENARIRAGRSYTYGKACSKCDAGNICDGFQNGYVSIFGTEEALPISTGAKITDPRHYISNQEKVVEVEDYEWAI